MFFSLCASALKAQGLFLYGSDSFILKAKVAPPQVSTQDVGSGNASSASAGMLTCAEVASSACGGTITRECLYVV